MNYVHAILTITVCFPKIRCQITNPFNYIQAILASQSIKIKKVRLCLIVKIFYPAYFGFVFCTGYPD